MRLQARPMTRDQANAYIVAHHRHHGRVAGHRFIVGAELGGVLSAVACAGKAFHHTESWNEEIGEMYEHLHGQAPSEWIQNAAQAAADEILRLRALVPTCARGPKACDAEIADLKTERLRVDRECARLRGTIESLLKCTQLCEHCRHEGNESLRSESVEQPK